MPEFMLVVAMGILNAGLFVFVLFSLRRLRESTEELTKLAKAIIAMCERDPEKKEKTESEKLSEQLEQGIVNVLNYKIEDALKERSYAGN